MNKHVSSVQITELADYDGWQLAWTPERIERFETAAAALIAIRRRDTQFVEVDGFDVAFTVVTWEPKTGVGRLIVEALQSSPKRGKR